MVRVGVDQGLHHAHDFIASIIENDLSFSVCTFIQLYNETICVVLRRRVWHMDVIEMFIFRGQRVGCLSMLRIVYRCSGMALRAHSLSLCARKKKCAALRVLIFWLYREEFSFVSCT